MTSDKGRVTLFLLPVVLLSGAMLWAFFPFTAEDAYIVARYAENLVDAGTLIYNRGEPVSALTSPLHALVEAALYALTGSSVPAWKFVSIGLLALSIGLALRAVRMTSWPLLLTLLLAAPPVLLWTMGGLETPLLLCLVTALTLLSFNQKTVSTGRLCALSVLAGLCFLTRYDSVLFTGPVLLHAAWKHRRPAGILTAAAVGAAAPLLWLLFSQLYYGDILPTSFYAKTPTRELAKVQRNFSYMAQYLLYTGVVPVAWFLLLPRFVNTADGWPRSRRIGLLIGGALLWLLGVLGSTVSMEGAGLPGNWLALFAVNGLFLATLFGLLGAGVGSMLARPRSIPPNAALYVGLGLVLLYGLTSATVHMMFSFRFFVPYLPPCALLLAKRVPRDGTGERVMGTRAAAGLLALLLCWQGFQGYYIYAHSLNGLALVSEYRRESLRSYSRLFMPLLEQSARDMQAHWASIDPDRPPRLYTYAAGIQPYIARDAYIYEKLISYRHGCGSDSHRLGVAAADYLALMVPRHGSLQKQLDRLPSPPEQYPIISAYQLPFDDALENLFIVHNPQPQPENPLPPRINGSCPR